MKPVMAPRERCDRFAGLKRRLASTVAAAAIALTALAGGVVGAQPAVAQGRQSSLTSEDLTAFFDRLVPAVLRRGDVAGAVLVVVKDGKVLFAKGYGYADTAKRVEVTADQTIFRAGSISKLFTWTAVMQLVQEHKLDLDQDVNSYLDFKIPEKFGKPITMRDLMTHTAGFADVGGGEVRGAKQLQPLREYLVTHMPARIFPPGKIVAYSNYGATLAGYIVERLSGEPFTDYIAANILEPLGMSHSTFDQPLPAALARQMSNGYRAASQEKPVPFEFVQVVPAGALSATGSDIAHFMIAQLEGGSYDGASILDPALVQLMHSPQSRMAAGVNGFDLGFYQEDRNGQRIIGHAGDTAVFHSDLHLLLDRNVGVFMAFNSNGRAGGAHMARVRIFHAFLDRYFPYVPPGLQTPGYARRDAARVAGWYESSRRGEGMGRLMAALREVRVISRADGTITVNALRDSRGRPERWHEVGPLAYQKVGGQDHLDFVTDARGGIAYWISDAGPPVEVFQRVHGLRQLPALEALCAASVAVWLLALILWTAGRIRPRRPAQAPELRPLAARLRLASRVGVVILLALFADLARLPPPTPATLTTIYVLGALAILGGVAIVAEAASRLMQGPGGRWARVGALGLGVSAIYAIWAILALGLASFNFII